MKYVRLFHVSNISVRKFRIFQLMYPGSVFRSVAIATIRGRDNCNDLSLPLSLPSPSLPLSPPSLSSSSPSVPPSSSHPAPRARTVSLSRFTGRNPRCRTAFPTGPQGMFTRSRVRGDGQMLWFHVIQVFTQPTKTRPAAPRGSFLTFDLFIAVNLSFVPALAYLLQ